MLSRLGLASAGLAGAFACLTPTAHAGGYDTPILYSAQHMGMGGAAIAFVDDPSAMFHNPAGLLGSKGLTLMANLTLVTGNITSAPAENNAMVESEPLLALAPLVGVSYNLNDVIAFGLTFYPVASAGAEYFYKDMNGVEQRDFTSVKFLELTPGVAVRLPGNLTLGAGYRVSFVSLGRYKGPSDKSSGNPQFDVDLSGVNLTGFRVGLQWKPIEQLELGLVYRSLTRTDIEADHGTALKTDRTLIKTEFSLPAKLGFGLRLNFKPVSVVLDVEYAFQSQNKMSSFTIEPALVPPPGEFNITSVFNWKDAVTLRGGVEYNVQDRWFFRGGFIFDGQVSTEEYPSAFGTPPSSTMTITAGFGTRCGDNWKLNFAVAHRMGSAVVDEPPGSIACLPCSKQGAYELAMTAAYVDFVYAFPNL